MLDYDSMTEYQVEPSDFEKAVRCGNADFIALAANQFDFDMNCFPDGGHPLTLACENGFLDVAKELVARGADIHGREHKRPTPLIIAAQNGHSQIVSWLIEGGVDINYVHEQVDSYGNWEWAGSALSVAILNSHFDIAEYLIDQGADIGSDMIRCFEKTDCMHGPNMMSASCPIIDLAWMDPPYLFSKAIRSGDLVALPNKLKSRVLATHIKHNVKGCESELIKTCQGILDIPIDHFVADGISSFPIELAAMYKNDIMLNALMDAEVNMMQRNSDGVLLFKSVANLWPEKAVDVLAALARQLDRKYSE